MTQPKTNRIPAPIYAAAGAGELALQQLRRLPTVVGELRDRAVADGGRVVSELGGKAVVTGFELRQKANDTLRNANRTAESLRQKAAPAADLNRLREHADLAKLREAADLHKLRETADLNKLRGAADLDRLRELATRNAAAVVAGAQAAQERALAAYGALVARGERVVGTGVLEVADTVNTDIEATEASVAAAPAAPAEETAPAAVKQADAAPAEVPSPAEVAEIVEAKPAAAKKTTRAKSTTRQTAAKRTDSPSAKLPRGAKRSQ
ncbi:hypothetical protein [Verrucosispora sioxanthis]|uniref:Heparin-binding hemagglutinin n=1 Tax=Verrucosispora sioxanthis TaxID=2499994 RepID=A0A6M1L8Q5_9ACTN|nr:hypothetical protein [Verrucosispora sioxanthis]NEE65513.1 hypothetical protein [Verrucosispora sioxanthis]NGM14623.1 hypothetical protein [Verrucosispora sioxanthis]